MKSICFLFRVVRILFHNDPTTLEQGIDNLDLILNQNNLRSKRLSIRYQLSQIDKDK